MSSGVLLPPGTQEDHVSEHPCGGGGPQPGAREGEGSRGRTHFRASRTGSLVSPQDILSGLSGLTGETSSRPSRNNDCRRVSVVDSGEAGGSLAPGEPRFASADRAVEDAGQFLRAAPVTAGRPQLLTITRPAGMNVLPTLCVGLVCMPKCSLNERKWAFLPLKKKRARSLCSD